MADEKKTEEVNDIPESVAARRLKALGGDTPTEGDTAVVKGNFLENFWYHHKWKTIIITASLFLLLICTLQMCTQNSYDVYLMYAGPGYLTVNETRTAQDAIKQIMPDYNEDGTRNVQFELNGMRREVAVRDPHASEVGRQAKLADEGDIFQIGASIPGMVSKVHVKVGDKVEENQVIAVIEAMKMETAVTAPCAGTVKEVLVSEGDTVKARELLIVLGE